MSPGRCGISAWYWPLVLSVKAYRSFFAASMAPSLPWSLARVYPFVGSPDTAYQLLGSLIPVLALLSRLSTTANSMPEPGLTVSLDFVRSSFALYTVDGAVMVSFEPANAPLCQTELSASIPPRLMITPPAPFSSLAGTYSNCILPSVAVRLERYPSGTFVSFRR